MTVASASRSTLHGKRIVVTRAAHQAGELDALLRDRGATPVAYPCIAIAAPEDAGPLDATLRDAARGEYDWLVLTSQNTVAILAERLAALGLSGAHLRGLAVAAVGPATAEAASQLLGLDAALAPDEHVAEALAAELVERLPAGQRVLLPQAEIARPVLAEQLAAGLQVTPVVAYRTVAGRGGVDLADLLARHEVDAITLTSSSTARYLVERLEREGGRRADLAGGCLACIGPETAATVRRLGLQVGVMAKEYTLAGLVAALEAYFAVN